jgi:hypothetical protein
MIFSKNTTSKPNTNIIIASNPNIPKIQNTAKIQNNTNTEPIYYMQNSMIGRLMNTKPCSSCPKY